MMSRNLPEFPSLEHLKKQAKARLRQLQQRDVGAKLTEAQLAIAREYGFASWTRLKTHIESLQDSSGSGGGGGGLSVGKTSPDDPGSGIFGRFTMRARRLIFFARYFAGKRGSDYIEVQHLLLGLLEEDADLIRRVVGNPRAVENVRAAVEGRHNPEGQPQEPRSIPLSEDCKHVLRHAAEEADRLGHANISTGHFWLSFLREVNSPTIAVLIEVLRQNGISLDKARGEIIANLDPL
jgi:ATP-dependent Clp protease ATP-binding subunit ClpC